MFASLSRPYKERSAQETITLIREILQKHRLLPEIIFTANPYADVYSARIVLPSSKGGYGSNGKGRSEDYCMASAYAEFIERLQTGLYAYFPRTLQSQLYREFGFYYDPREKYLTREAFNALPQIITDDLIRYSGPAKDAFVQAYFKRLEDQGLPGLIAMPFLCTKTQKIEYIPLNPLLILIGSNGIAAGNSYDEALHHALCELIERWAGAEIFYKRLTPPTVPDAFLRRFPEECSIIDKIEASGKYKVTIKDFSAGRRLPAVGIILRNTQTNTYRLNIGSDTSFQVALSRCLTEVFQGYADEETLDAILMDIPSEDPPYFTSDDEDQLNLRYEVFADFTKDGCGVFPPSLFGPHPSYPFDASVFADKGSYKEEAQALVNFFNESGSTVYIQESSFLGFPTVFTYVPEISTLGKKNVPLSQPRSTYEIIETDKIESKIFPVDYDSDEACRSLVTSLAACPAYRLITDLFFITLDEDAPQTSVNVAFLLAQLWFRLGQFDAAADAFFVYQEGLEAPSAYDIAMGAYMDARAAGRPAAEARQEVEKDLGSTQDVKRACDDLENHKAFFARLALPKCPDCAACPLASACVTKGQMGIARTLYPIMKEAFAVKA